MPGIEFEPLPGNFGVRALGVDISRQAGDELVRALAKQLFTHHIVTISGQDLTNDAYTNFGRLWGRPIQVFKKDARVGSHPEMVRQGNAGSTQPYMRNLANHWHSDSTYEAEPAMVTMIYGIESPDDGGETLFADLHAAYEALDDVTRQRIEGLVVHHRAGSGATLPDETILRQETLTAEQRATFVPLPDVTHPLVMRHPVTGRRGLYGICGSAFEIVGISPEEGLQLLTYLKQHAIQDTFRQSYKLMPGDLLLWDNLGAMHRATPIEYTDEPGRRRLNYRISVKGLPPCLGM